MSLIDGIEHLALIKGVVTGKITTMVRVHSFNIMSDLLGELNGKYFYNMKFSLLSDWKI